MRFIGILSIILILALTGCRQSVDGTQQPTNGANATPSTGVFAPNVALSIDPAQPEVGDSLLVFTITDSTGAPMPSAQIRMLRAEGDMTHAGMSPVIEEGRAGGYVTDQAGRFEMGFNFNMAGDWIISANVTLIDGSVITGRLTVSVR